MKDKEVRKAMQDLGHQTQLTYTEVASLFPPSQQGAGEEVRYPPSFNGLPFRPPILEL